MLEFLRKHFPRLIDRLFQARKTADKVISPDTIYGNEAAAESVISTLFVVAGLGLLFGPMWWLAFVSDTLKRLGIITGFVAFFALVVHAWTDIQPQEALAAATA